MCRREGFVTSEADAIRVILWSTMNLLKRLLKEVEMLSAVERKSETQLEAEELVRMMKVTNDEPNSTEDFIRKARVQP